MTSLSIAAYLEAGLAVRVLECLTHGFRSSKHIKRQVLKTAMFVLGAAPTCLEPSVLFSS